MIKYSSKYLAPTQRGASLLTTVFLLSVIIGLALIGIKVFPSVAEYFEIKKTINKMSAAATPEEARSIYVNADMVSDFKSLSVEDIEIAVNNGRMQISFAYDKEIKLVEPVYLLIKYTGSSKKVHVD